MRALGEHKPVKLEGVTLTHCVEINLPAGITLRPDELHIQFSGTEDLLRLLFELSQAILNDYAQFESLVEGTV